MMNEKRHTATITKVTPIMPDETTLSGYLVETDCGHSFTGVPHAWFPVGDSQVCSTHDADCGCYYCVTARETREHEVGCPARQGDGDCDETR